jgi:hypothetical protein
MKIKSFDIALERLFIIMLACRFLVRLLSWYQNKRRSYLKKLDFFLERSVNYIHYYTYVSFKTIEKIRKED